MIRKLSIFAILILGLSGVTFMNAGPAWADAVTLRASLQQGNGRVTFRWSQPVGHQIQQQGNRLMITFSRPIEANWSATLGTLAAFITGVEPAPNEATVVLRLADQVTSRSYDAGSSVVLDLISSNPRETKTETKTETQASTAGEASGLVVPLRIGEHPNYSRLVLDWPTTTKFSLSRTAGTASIRFEGAGQMNVAALNTGTVKYIQGASVTGTADAVTLTLTVPQTADVKAFTSGKKVVVDVYGPGITQAQVANAPGPKSLEAKPEPEPTATAKVTATAPAPKPIQAEPVASVAPVAPVAPVGKPVALNAPNAPTVTEVPKAPVLASSGAELPETTLVSEEVEGGGVALRFDWDEPVGAAVFRRGGALWVVFDKRTNLNTPAMAQATTGLVKSVEQVLSNAGTVLRLVTVEGVNPKIKRSGLAWILEFGKNDLLPATPLQVDAQPTSELGARLFVAIPEPGNVVAFQDPEIGDNLVVVPVIPLGHGISRSWKYPQVQILQSKQGVVIRPITDDVRVRALRQGVELTSGGTLQISKVTDEERAYVQLDIARANSAGMGASGPLSKILDLQKWRRADLQDFVKLRQGLQLDISISKGVRAREKARYELLNFYFSNGFEAEALGVLEVIRTERPAIEEDRKFRLMRGIASWLMGRMVDARRDLYHASLDGNDESKFWRAAVVASEGNLPDVAYEIRQVGAISQLYPQALKMPTASLVAEAAIELGDVKQATQYLEILEVDGPTLGQKNQIDYLTGKLQALSGEFDAAISTWETVMEGIHRPSRAKAAYARTEMLLKQDLFTPADAIEEFEKLRFVWRGDDFEFELLRRLGSLYIEEFLYRDGLNALRQAATHFPDHENANAVTKQMSDVFVKLYIEDGADVLPPVTAIALYDEFRELTPAGEAGDEMIRKLADRLVGVDLLGQAANLLDGQTDFRLTGENKSRVGARLALIHLLDRKYDLVLDSLDKTQVSSISEALTTDRILLRAQAKFGLKEPQAALDLIENVTSISAEQMRATLYWDMENWKDASKSLATLLRLINTKSRSPLSEDQARAVFSLAIAYTLDGNEAGISRLLISYGAAMNDLPYADAFSLITSGPERGTLNYRGLDQMVKNVTDFRGFMETYRERLAEGQLSSLY